MAFGFGFNKQKVLSAAEKCVQQGKLQNAISEYEKIVKNDAKDLTVMNTIGDLYARLGDNNKAADSFKNVGDAYASQGFTVKAIAMYKKLSKLKPSMECVLRLAELYTQQGLFNDARAQYLLVAEDFLKSGQLDQAVRIFQKTLEMDPDNVPMRTKLAEVYVRLGKKEEAWKLLTAAAEALRAKGQLAAADEILQRMLKLEPGNSYALMLRGRAAIETGDFKAAIECLSGVPDLDNNVDGLRSLFQAYLRSKRFKDAATLAAKLANIHDDISAIVEYSEAALEAQQYRDVLQVYEQFSDRMLRNDAGKFLECLRAVIRHVQDDPQALESVLAMFQKAGENTHVTEIYELLAHGYVQSGDLEKARDYYLKLMQLEPANQMHASNYQQVLEKLGITHTEHLITAEEGAVLIEELEATAPFIDQRYDDEIALAVRAALTDAELFISYNMAAKALAPLTDALPKASRDLRLNQKLAALHTRAERFAEAAVCCRTLESVYHDAGHAEEASRYGDLASKYEERSTASGTSKRQEATPVAIPPAAPEFEISAPVIESAGPAIEKAHRPEPAAVQPASLPSGLFFHGAPPSIPSALDASAVADPSVSARVETTGEVDLSSEWEEDLTVGPSEIAPQVGEIPQQPSAEAADEAMPLPEVAAIPASVNVDESVEEVRFYLGQGMIEQAETVLARLEALAPGAPELAVLRLGIESAKQVPSAEPEPEIAVEEAAAIEEAVAPDTTMAVSVPPPQPWPSERPVLQDMVSELEASLGDGFLPETKGEDLTAVETSAVAPETAASHAQAGFRSGTLDEFVSDLEASLGSDFPAPVENTAPAPAIAHEVAPAIAHEDIPLRAAAAAATGPGTIDQPVTTSQAEHQVVSPMTSVQPFAGVDLSDMFGELKHELEEGVTSADEDPETHYNLGVAFREMGLLDEAIGELQKVCQSVDHGHPFSQIMQTYTWLAQCFLDKGVPEVAVRWYEKALKLPSLDQETRTALHYELASSLESAGNNPAALSNFLEVYGNNIDYRDVGERIKALRT